MAKNKNKHGDKRKLIIQAFALTLCVMLAGLTIVSSYLMIAG